MGLHWGGPGLRSLIGDKLWSNIQSVHVDPSVPVAETEHLQFMNAQTGEVMNSVPVQNWYRLKRRALREYLASGELQSDHPGSKLIDLRFNKRLDSLDFGNSDIDPVTAHFTDGTTLTSKIVIGADGPRSRVRELLIKNPDHASPSRLPYFATFLQTRFTAPQALFLRKFHPLYLAGVHPLGHFCFFGIQDIPDPNDPTTWLFFFYISAGLPLSEIDQRKRPVSEGGWTSKQWVQEAKKWAAESYCEPWKSAFEWVDEETQEVWPWGFNTWDPREEKHEWNTYGGRATLVGDAGHIMTVQRGQGLNHSVMDAKNLCDALVKSFEDERSNVADGSSNKTTDVKVSRAELIAGYEKEMKERTGEEVQLCAINTVMLHDWQNALQSPVLGGKGMKRA
jgi:2-polyprenyl-6-methoxyphenol hydroxylase-like FAD-dependent oxidoreductase